ncbi:MAG: arabinogalactan endo-1,4-beta-galactosidase [Chloroflexi bacterium]|nr:arabinogalactan endo-1,4-beta-galactosidase [Chloroflexota bacterium]MBU1752011.1 arabinogalactan endo-1,4-beta-galactosidase [Chloroflexota bacterium]MBU1880226.1 arabinogalactan endo-1,4-beta-galactosidase [Chloroflexota bacterium]
MRHAHPVRLTLSLVLFAFLILACNLSPLPPTGPAPTLPPVSTRLAGPAPAITPIAAEGFDAGIEGWWDGAGEGASSQVSWDPAGRLLWSVELVPKQAAWLIREWPALSDADGLTLRLASLDRAGFYVLGLHEADGSVYNLSLYLDAGESATHTVDFAWFGLQGDSEDENDQLDRDQLVRLSLADIAGFLGAPAPNRLAIDEVVLWQGTPEPPDLLCAGSRSSTPIEGFRTGVDANYVPQGEMGFVPGRRGYWAGEDRVDPLELFAANGVDAFRVRLWVGKKGDSKLDYATDLARRAQAAGLRPYLVIFLSEDWSDVNKQPAPTAWASLSLDERADAVRTYARETAQHFIDQGIQIDYYEIGNEIDYGICGVFADETQPRDVASLRAKVWPDEALLIQAAIAGVREADPAARFLLHIAASWDPAFAAAFFQAMTELGVEYEYAGLSYYPSAFGVPMAARLCETLDRLRAEVGKPVVIAEAAYPAAPMTGDMFEEWRNPLPGYPLTPEGQAWWLADFLAAMRARGDVLGVYYFSPGFYFSGELWGPLALFDGEGRARPAIASFAAPSGR